MNDSLTESRRRTAAIARSYLGGSISWKDFMDETAEFEGDTLIDELVDLIEHEPKRGGFMGVNDKEWLQSQHAIMNIITALESNGRDL